MLKVISAGLWNVIVTKGKQASTRRAAIAFVGDSPPLAFGEGDLLIVDASDASVKSGRTSAKTLEQFHGAGAELFSCSNLHAKAMLLDDWVVIGSANDSQQSATAYVEAAIVSDRPELAGQVERLIATLAKQSAPIDTPFLRRILALPVTRTFPLNHGHGRKRQRKAIKLDHRTWFVSLRGEATYPGDEEKVQDIAEQEQRKVGRRAGHVDWFFWSGNSRFSAEAREGDTILECWRPHAKIATTRSVRIHRHARVLRIFKEPGVKAVTFHCLWPPDSEQTALSWSEFTKLAERVGIRHKITYRSTFELSEQQGAALHELWPR